MQAHKSSNRVSGKCKYQNAVIMPAKPKWFAGTLTHFVKNSLHTYFIQCLRDIIKSAHADAAGHEDHIIILKAIANFFACNYWVIGNMQQISVQIILGQYRFYGVTV